MGPNGEDGGYRIWLTPLTGELYGPLRPSLRTLAAAAVLLLFLGLINTALLWLGRAAQRRRDASIRLMLGASPARVAADLAVETLAPTTLGGLLALGVSVAALSLLNAAQPPELATTGTVSLHVGVLLSVLALSAVANMLFSLLPLRSLLRAPSPARPSGRTYALLIGAQAALVCALLVPSLLLVRSLATLQSVDPGFVTHGLLTASVTLPESRYRSPEQLSRFFTLLEASLTERFPARAALLSRLPLGLPEGGDPFSIEGRAYSVSGTIPQIAHRLLASQHTLDVFNLRLLEGRGFEGRDFDGDTRIVLVNETLARGFFPGQSPVGRRIVMGAPRPGVPWLTIAGVVADLHTARLDLAPIPQVFQPFWQAPTRTMAVIIRGATPADLRQILVKLDPDVPAYRLQPIEQHFARATAAPRLRTSIFSTYAALAFLLAAFGVYSLTTWSVARQLREFALRSALGATPMGLLRTILLRTLRPASIGVITGLAAAYTLARALAAHLYQASPDDPAPYFVAATLALIMTAVATLPAARSAFAANPAQLLRSE
jgi:putative ABC transport system permease protein